MNKMSLFDMSFFIAETADSPKHVAGLIVFKRPENSKASFVKDLHEELLTFTDVHAPFNRMVEFSYTAAPRWKDCAVDLNNHVFYQKMDKSANSHADLHRLVADLHTPMLDRSRPLWEAHLIDGIEGNRFATYVKIHHAYADGVTISRWGAQMLSESPDEMGYAPIWSKRHGGYVGRGKTRIPKVVQSVKDNIKTSTKRFLGIGRLATMLLLETVHLTKNAIALPYVYSGHTPLTGQVTAGRQFSTAIIDMKLVNRICKQTRSTLNHVALTCLDAALHRYLEDQGVKMDRPLTIVMPVNLRREGDKSAGNKIGFVEVELSALTDDPYVRLRNVGFSLRNVRTLIDNVAPEAIETYTVLTGIVGFAAERLRLSDRLPPMGTTLVSNVPGPRTPLYLKGALAQEMTPVSTLPPGNLLNITLFSYADQLAFCLIAVDKLPDLNRLSGYINDAFAELSTTVHEIKHA